MFIVSLSYKVDFSAVEPHFDAHMDFVTKYFDQGIFIAAGRKVPRTGGVIMALAKDKDELEQVLEQDPFITEDVASYTVTEFMPSRVAEGLELLISQP